MDEFGKDKFDIVVPATSIFAEPPVALVEGNVDRKGTRKQAEAYLQFLYSDRAQAIFAKHHYRPFMAEAARKEDLDLLPEDRHVHDRILSGQLGRYPEEQFR